MDLNEWRLIWPVHVLALRVRPLTRNDDAAANQLSQRQQRERKTLHLVYLHQYQDINQINTITQTTNLLIASTLSYVTHAHLQVIQHTLRQSATTSEFRLLTFNFQNAASVRLDDSKAVHKGYCSITLTLPAQKSPGDYRSPNTSKLLDNSSIFVCTMQTAQKSLQVAAKTAHRQSHHFIS